MPAHPVQVARPQVPGEKSAVFFHEPDDGLDLEVDTWTDYLQNVFEVQSRLISRPVMPLWVHGYNLSLPKGLGFFCLPLGTSKS